MLWLVIGAIIAASLLVLVVLMRNAPTCVCGDIRCGGGCHLIPRQR